MSTELIHTIIFAGGYLGLFALGELLFHFAKVEGELTRKLVHIGTGLICLLWPIYFTTYWAILALTSSFLVILGLSLKFNLLQSINKIDRKSHGSVLYPIIMNLCWLIYLYVEDINYFYLPVLILAISDPVAALVGKRWPIGPYKIIHDTKSLAGSTAFFLSAVGISCIFLFSTRESHFEIILIALCVSLVTTLAEAVSQRGFDNLFIPLSAVVTLYGLDYLLQ